MKAVRAAAMALVLAPGLAVGGPKWDATVKACGDAYDRYYTPNVANPGAGMASYYTIGGEPALEKQCTEQALGFVAGRSVDSEIAGSAFTADGYRNYVARLLQWACLASSIRTIDPASYEVLDRKTVVAGCKNSFSAKER